MKPIQIGLLVAAGALGGALLMKWQSTRQPGPAPVAASVPAAQTAPASAATPAEPAEPAPAATPEEPASRPPAAAPDRPSPSRPKATRKAPPAPEVVPPAVIAQNDGPPPPPARPAPVQPANPAAEPAPPVRTAPPAAVEPAREPAAPAPPAEPNRVTLTTGTLLAVRLQDGLTTERNLPGDTFTATLDVPIAADGFVIAERGARVEGKVVESTKAGKVSGVSSLGIVLTRVRLSDGQWVPVTSQTFTRKGPTSHGEDAAKVGAGAGIGAIIGAIAGGGKGAGIGAGVGGAAGAGDVLLTRGKPAALPSETRINFRLAQPVTITERR